MAAAHLRWRGRAGQIVPAAMEKMFKDHASEKSERVMTALLRMKKLDIEKLEQAYAG